jgi:5-methylcytosine-specific restriction endonuclease McrA
MPLNGNQRKRARKWLAAALREQDRRCFWCGRPLVLRRTIRRTSEVVSMNQERVTWVGPGGRRVSCCLATADHLRPVSDGGPNERENVVAACYRCNTQRTAEPTRRDPDTCAKCGGPKARGRAKRCDVCRMGDPARWPEWLRAKRAGEVAERLGRL